MMDNTVFAGSAPWVLWGNTIPLSAPPSPLAGDADNVSSLTLCRVQYNRPETWRFLFSARIISAPEAAAGESAQLEVSFKLLTGIGRSAIIIPTFSLMPLFAWDGIGPVPIPRTPFWTNQATYDVPPAIAADLRRFTDTVVGQDMTLTAEALFRTDIAGATPAVVEVSAQFAPNVHVRPDWFQIDGHAGEQFSGAETKGR
jgi:hypothetical protein